MADKPHAFPWLNTKGPQEGMPISTLDPAVAEQCKQQLVQQHLLFKQQTAALASAVYRQVSLANEVPVFVEEDGARVQVWNPLEAVKAEIAAAQAQGVHYLHQVTRLLSMFIRCTVFWCPTVHWPAMTYVPAGASAEETTPAAAAAAAVAATTTTVSSPEKSARLVPEQEQVLLRFFGAQDRVDPEEASLLARQVQELITLHEVASPSCVPELNVLGLLPALASAAPVLMITCDRVRLLCTNAACLLLYTFRYCSITERQGQIAPSPSLYLF